MGSGAGERRVKGGRFHRVARWGALLTFATLKLASPWEKWPVHWGDDKVWFNIAQSPWFSRDLWFSYRPFTVPVIHKIFGYSEDAVVWFQSGLAIVSWALFADALSRCLHRRWLSLCALVAVLGVALTSPVHNWDMVIRSESASTSFLFLSLGAVLRAIGPPFGARRARRWWGALALAAAVLAAFARDTNAYVLVLAAGLVLVFVVVARLTAPAEALALARARRFEPGSFGFASFLRRRADLLGGLALAIGLLLVSGGAMRNARQSERYVFPLMNVIFQRVLPKKHKLAYFRDELGMPVSRALMQRSRKFASSDRRIAFKSPALEDFRAWLSTDGYAAYQRYLLAHLELTFSEADRSFPAMVRERFGRLARGNSYPVTERLDEWLVTGKIAEYPRETVLLTFVISALGLIARRRDLRLLALFGLFSTAVTVSQAYICFHGDAMEVVRHAMVVGVFIRIGAVTALILVLDGLAAAIASIVPAGTGVRVRDRLRPGWLRRPLPL